LIPIESIRDFVQKGNYEFYSHAITEAKKDGVEPENVVYVLLTGKIIERYPKRRRVLVYGTMLNGLPVHVVCDYSDEDIRVNAEKIGGHSTADDAPRITKTGKFIRKYKLDELTQLIRVCL